MLLFVASVTTVTSRKFKSQLFKVRGSNPILLLVWTLWTSKCPRELQSPERLGPGFVHLEPLYQRRASSTARFARKTEGDVGGGSSSFPTPDGRPLSQRGTCEGGKESGPQGSASGRESRRRSLSLRESEEKPPHDSGSLTFSPA